MQSTTGNKKAKQILQAKKDFVTCSKLITNKLRCCLTRSHNVYFANNKQASNAELFFTFAKHNLIKLKLHNN